MTVKKKHGAETELLMRGGCMPVYVWCPWSRGRFSAVAVSGERLMKAANLFMQRMWSRRVSSAKSRTAMSSIMRWRSAPPDGCRRIDGHRMFLLSRWVDPSCSEADACPSPLI
jgi:hypothetical protein